MKVSNSSPDLFFSISLATIRSRSEIFLGRFSSKCLICAAATSASVGSSTLFNSISSSFTA